MSARKLKLLQSIDRRVGPWLCRHVTARARALRRTDGPRTRQPAAIQPDVVHRILVIRPGGLGDAALTYPMLMALRKHFPQATLDVLVEKRNAGVYSIAKIVDDIYHYDVRTLTVFRRLTRKRYDLVIDTDQYHHLSTIFANALRPRYLCGFDALGRSRFQTHSAAYSESSYEVFSFLKLAETILGEPVPFDTDRAFIEVEPHTLAWAEQQCRAAGIQNFVAVTPGAGGAYRLWPAERYAEVVAWLNRRNCAVVLLGGQDGTAAAKLITARNDPERVFNLAGKTTLAQTAALLHGAKLSLSADTGVMHLAYGVGTPTVALFGPGLHCKWAPPGKRHTIVRKGLSCSPCTRSGRVPPCPHGIACMQDISVNDVVAALEERLDS